MGVIQTKPYGPYGSNTIWEHYPKWAQCLDLFSKIWTNFNNLEQNLKIPMSNLRINEAFVTDLKLPGLFLLNVPNGNFGQFFDYFFNLNNSTMAIRLVWPVWWSILMHACILASSRLITLQVSLPSFSNFFKNAFEYCSRMVIIHLK